MHIVTETHNNLTCEIEADEIESQYTGTLKYNSFEIGRISGPELAEVRSQFHTIASMVDEGAQVRHGIIVCGYNSDDLRGDVLLLDGEVLGSWYMDDEEWCHFTESGSEDVTCQAPSAWLMHDTIAEWHADKSANLEHKLANSLIWQHFL